MKRHVDLPIAGEERWLSLYGDFPLSEDEWNQMLKLLEAMKPGLTEESEADEESEAEVGS